MKSARYNDVGCSSLNQTEYSLDSQHSLLSTKPNKIVKPKRDEKNNKKETRWNQEKALQELIEPNVNDFVAAAYEKKVYVEKVHDVEENEA